MFRSIWSFTEDTPTSTNKELMTALCKTMLDLSVLSEAFREVEMLFMATAKQQPEHLATLCHIMLNNSLEIPNAPTLPTSVYRINVKYDQVTHNWTTTQQTESVTESDYYLRVVNFRKTVAIYRERNHELVKIYLLRQRYFYEGKQSSLLLNSVPTESIKTILNKLENQFAGYQSLLCHSPVDSASITYQILQEAKTLSPQHCQNLILALFVGRDITQPDERKAWKLQPRITKYLESLGDTCLYLHGAIDKINQQASVIPVSVFNQEERKSEVNVTEPKPEEAETVDTMSQRRISGPGE